MSTRTKRLTTARRVIVVVVVLAGCIWLGLASADPGLARAATTGPGVLTCSGKVVDRPARYLMSCADGNAWWRKADWPSWGPHRAAAAAQLWQNDCVPTCAAGRFHAYHSGLTLSGVVATRDHGELYSRATFSYRRGGKPATEVVSLAT